jgi:hypothetical protein
LRSKRSRVTRATARGVLGRTFSTMTTPLPLFDVAVLLPNQPGALATLGETLGRARISLEGGGAWVVDGRGQAHFLVAEGEAARAALTAAGLEVVAVREVIAVRLNQGEPGQLGNSRGGWPTPG